VGAMWGSGRKRRRDEELSPPNFSRRSRDSDATINGATRKSDLVTVYEGVDIRVGHEPSSVKMR